MYIIILIHKKPPKTTKNKQLCVLWEDCWRFIKCCFLQNFHIISHGEMLEFWGKKSSKPEICAERQIPDFNHSINNSSRVKGPAKQQLYPEKLPVKKLSCTQLYWPEQQAIKSSSITGLLYHGTPPAMLLQGQQSEPLALRQKADQVLWLSLPLSLVPQCLCSPQALCVSYQQQQSPFRWCDKTSLALQCSSSNTTPMSLQLLEHFPSLRSAPYLIQENQTRCLHDLHISKDALGSRELFRERVQC